MDGAHFNYRYQELKGSPHLELNTVGLAGDIDAVRYHAHFTEQRQLVLGQQTVCLVQQKVSPESVQRSVWPTQSNTRRDVSDWLIVNFLSERHVKFGRNRKKEAAPASALKQIYLIFVEKREIKFWTIMYPNKWNCIVYCVHILVIFSLKNFFIKLFIYIQF